MDEKDQQIDELEQQVAALQAEIERLKSELYTTQLRMAGGVAGVSAGIDEIIEQADRDRQWYESQIDQYKRTAPVNALAPPLILPDNVLKKIAQQAGRPLTSFKNSILVDTRIGIRYGEQPNDWEVFSINGGFAWFPGNRESFKQEVLPRVMNLFRRSPLPENKGRAGLVGLPDETMLDVMLRLSECRYNPDYESHWDTRFGLLFETVIWPEVKGHYAYPGGKDTARNRALKEILRRFKHMEGEGRGKSE